MSDLRLVSTIYLQRARGNTTGYVRTTSINPWAEAIVKITPLFDNIFVVIFMDEPISDKFHKIFESINKIMREIS